MNIVTIYICMQMLKLRAPPAFLIRTVWYDVTRQWELQIIFHLRYWNPREAMDIMAESVTGGQWEYSSMKC